MIKVMIVDDHALVRAGIKALLADIRGMDVIAEADSGETALQMARVNQPDVVLLDMKMPGIGGLETTHRFQRNYPDVKIVAVSAFSSDPYPARVMQAGATGYLTKECALEEMCEAIKKVFVGKTYITQSVATQMALRSLDESQDKSNPFECLSERELQIMIMITSGARVQEISDQLHLSTKTVNSYRYRLFEKLKIRNDVELTHLAMRYQLLDSPSEHEVN